MDKIRLPLGVDLFEEVRRNGFYYIDKTEFIYELLQTQFKVTLITRPRRFGKTLAMSMLADFFDIRKDSREIFAGLAISARTEFCAQWMNQWPVLFVTFKDIEDLTFAQAYEQLVFTIADLCAEHEYLLHSNRVSETDRKMFSELLSQTASGSVVRNSLFLLIRMMKSHYGRKVILLIDEYDVPLAKASEHGYYEEMLNCIRGVLSKSLKTNPYLCFAVITGCLRIAKESIFTGTNHFVSNSISGSRYTDTFGFVQEDVEKLLADTGLTKHMPEIRRWYDGYQIGRFGLYCPWDVLSYVSDLQADADAKPGNYWKDTSHNDIVRSFIGQKGFNITDKLETLLAGGHIQVCLADDLTYDLVHSSEENFWSILYLTGYLTKIREEDLPPDISLGKGETALRIPNEEVKIIFAETIAQWFKDSIQKVDRRPLMEALWAGEDAKASAILSQLLFATISYYNYKEDYYQAFLTGIFVGLGYETESDKEHGEGRPDVVVKDRENRRVLIIEAKCSRNRQAMERDCMEAVKQIEAQKYTQDYLEGYRAIVCYGAAFYKKECLIRKAEACHPSFCDVY